jgi:PAS domain S-box-containing protein
MALHMSQVDSAKAFDREVLRLAAIVNSSDDAIVSKDLNGIVQTWNRAAERIFGYSADEMVGQSILRIIPSDRQAEEHEVLRRIRAGLNVEHFETVRQRKDGSLIEISLTVSPIRTPSGEVIGASKIARDITAQRQLTRALEQAVRAKDEFVAMLSHELRTPLNAVLGYLHMLRSGQLAEAEHGRALEVIERNARMLSQLVSDVLDVSSIVTGKIKVDLALCDLAPVVSAAVDSIRPTADAKAVRVDLDLPDSPQIVRCDVDRMQQVFWNLLSNAVKFTPGGGTVRVVLHHDGGSVRVEVADTGAGIASEALPFIFQRFWQGDRDTGRSPRGLGLGLALARHFVELHGGTICAASPGEGLGSTFVVTLPRLGSGSR